MKMLIFLIRIFKKYQNLEVAMTQKKPISNFFRPTVLHDLAASRLVKSVRLNQLSISCDLKLTPNLKQLEFVFFPSIWHHVCAYFNGI